MNTIEVKARQSGKTESIIKLFIQDLIGFEKSIIICRDQNRVKMIKNRIIEELKCQFMDSLIFKNSNVAVNTFNGQNIDNLIFSIKSFREDTLRGIKQLYRVYVDDYFDFDTNEMTLLKNIYYMTNCLNDSPDWVIKSTATELYDRELVSLIRTYKSKFKDYDSVLKKYLKEEFYKEALRLRHNFITFPEFEIKCYSDITLDMSEEQYKTQIRGLIYK